MPKTIKIVIVAMILFSLPINTVNAKWAYPFIVYNKNIYVISDQKVNAELIETKIGRVTKYSSREGTYSGNFSNTYPKGTEYYKIKDTDITERIAIKENDASYTVANYYGEYTESKFSIQAILLYTIGLFILVILIWWFVRKRLLNKTNL